jgi:aspartate aminotransferase-like enzyme
MVGHRSSAMAELVARTDEGLVHAFGLDDGSDARVGIAPTSGTGMMEGALLGVGERVLCIVGGAFAKRWAEIARTLGKDVRVLEAEWGSLVDDVELADILDHEGPFDAVTMVASETSTGTLTPIKYVSNVLQAFPDTLLLVDVVTLLAGGVVDFDECVVDFAFAGTQKALACPPGLAVFCASEDWIESAEGRERRSWYLDPLRHLEGQQKRSTPTTPAIPLYRALALQLEDITAGRTLPPHRREHDGAPVTGRAAWEARYAEHDAMRARTLEWAASRGLAPLPAPEHSSPTVSCLRTAPDADAHDLGALVTGLAERGLVIGGGYGPLKGETFRIGHMGDHTEAELVELLAAADELLG